jgi:hypothetical protein
MWHCGVAIGWTRDGSNRITRTLPAPPSLSPFSCTWRFLLATGRKRFVGGRFGRIPFAPVQDRLFDRHMPDRNPAGKFVP